MIPTRASLGPGHTELESRWFQSKDFLAARESRSHYVFEPGAFESRSDCACATYPSAGRLPRRRNTKVSQCSSSQSGKSCSTSRKELKNCVSEAPSPRTWRRPKPCPSPRESECLRKFILAENESPELQHRHATDREVSDPTESASTSAVRSSSIFLAATRAVSDAWLYSTQGNMQEMKAFSSKNLTRED